MSIRAIVWAYNVIDKSDAMTAAAAAVLAALAHFHNQESGRCDPSNESLCRRTKLCERTVRKALRELEAARIIKTIQRKSGSGRGKANLTNRYVLRVPAGAAAPQPAPDAGSPQPAPDAATWGTTCPLTLTKGRAAPSVARWTPQPASGAGSPSAYGDLVMGVDLAEMEAEVWGYRVAGGRDA